LLSEKSALRGEKTEGFSQWFGNGIVVVSGVASFRFFFWGGGGGGVRQQKLRTWKVEYLMHLSKHPLYFARQFKIS
jgi:hypothetical protein